MKPRHFPSPSAVIFDDQPQPQRIWETLQLETRNDRCLLLQQTTQRFDMREGTSLDISKAFLRHKSHLISSSINFTTNVEDCLMSVTSLGAISRVCRHNKKKHQNKPDYSFMMAASSSCSVLQKPYRKRPEGTTSFIYRCEHQIR